MHYRKIFDFKPWTSVRELIQCLNRINFEYLLYQKRLCFLRNMMLCNNSVIASIIGVFVCTNEYVTVSLPHLLESLFVLMNM